MGGVISEMNKEVEWQLWWSCWILSLCDHGNLLDEYHWEPCDESHEALDDRDP